MLAATTTNGFLVPLVKSNSQIRKTVLDLRNLLKNHTHFSETDITISTVVRDNVETKSPKNSPVFFLPGLDMPGLSVYPNMIRASDNRDVYVGLAGYSHVQTLKT